MLPVVAPAVQQSQPGLAPAEQLDQQGRSLYESGQYAAAAEAFLQAAQAYETEGNILKQAIALSNRALACQQVGLWQEANLAIGESLALLGEEEQGGHQQPLALAQVLDIQGNLLLAQGQSEQALEVWERAAAFELNQKLIELPDTPAMMAGLQSLGEALRVIGDLKSAREILHHSLAMAQRLQQPEAIATVQFRLANVMRTKALANLNRTNLTLTDAAELMRKGQQGDRRSGIDDAEKFYNAMHQALELYDQVITTSTSTTTKIQAQLNQLRSLIELEQWSDAQSLLAQIQQPISTLPPNRTAIYARINLAQSLMKSAANSTTHVQAAQLLATAMQQAKSFRDARAESYALGNLGELYEQVHQFTEAQQLTRQALLLAQSNNALDIAYRWQWQLGRLLKAQADAEGADSTAYEGAIAAYTEAVNTLKSIRSDLVAITPDEQLSFRDTIEPIYRQLVALLLNTQDVKSNTSRLQLAREVIESLQLAELDNFFRAACLDANPTLVDEVDPSAAIFYSITLPDQLAVIVSLPLQPASQTSSPLDSRQQTLDFFTIPISEKEIKATVSLLQDSLDQANDNRFLEPAQQLYRWLIQPVAAQLQTHHVKTLVFVLDGVLRNVPMAVLHDGQQYLIEQPYNMALTPGLQLLGTQPLSQQQLQSALLAGITKARPGFSALPRVRDELVQIQSEIPDTTILLDDDPVSINDELTIDGRFTSDNFRTVMRTTNFPVIHLATHGQFSSQVDETFILTGDNRLSIEELKNMLQSTTIDSNNPLELLVFSACETATGDQRAALGLAGVAVRAGARSTVATLWQVNDHSSAVFMGQFYRELAKVRESQMTKAEALHRAQLSLLQNPDYQHPYFWAPYVLLGNWR
jgi:CHAT domain-containing protein